MPRTEPNPPFPETPGTWLTCFRHRLAKSEGISLSPEKLGQRLGHSGSTVRRWEQSHLAPTATDLAGLGEELRLSADEFRFLAAVFTEAQFSSVAVNGSRVGRTPDLKGMTKLARSLLDVPFPAVLVDDLFFVRGWNDAADLLIQSGPKFGELGHVLEPLFGAELYVTPEEDAEQIALRWLRDFRLATAAHCGRPEYRDLLTALSNYPGFRKLWLELALGWSRDDLGLTNVPHFSRRVGLGTLFRTMTRFSTPLTYFLFQYFSVDEVASQLFSAQLKQDAPDAGWTHLKSRLHWNQSGAELATASLLQRTSHGAG